MKWNYILSGEHVHVTVYINGALSGKLTFRQDEFRQIVRENSDEGGVFLTFNNLGQTSPTVESAGPTQQRTEKPLNYPSSPNSTE